MKRAGRNLWLQSRSRLRWAKSIWQIVAAMVQGLALSLIYGRFHTELQGHCQQLHQQARLMVVDVAPGGSL
eukprot:12399997-Karenia_brevis.AAC.1